MSGKIKSSKAVCMVMIIMAAASVFLGCMGTAAYADNIYVKDYAGVLSESTKEGIRSLNKKLEESDREAQILVVTVRSIPDGEPIEDYSMQIAEKYKPGSGTKDTGIVYVVAVDDHKDRLEVGYGLEDVIPDSMASRILKTRTDAYRSGNWDSGVKSVTDGVGKVIMTGSLQYEYADHSGVSSGSVIKFFYVLAVIVMAVMTIIVICALIVNDTKYRMYGRRTSYYKAAPRPIVYDYGPKLARMDDDPGDHHDDDDFTPVVPMPIDLGSSDSYSSSDDSSFDSFGGGDFGGGGASGSW